MDADGAGVLGPGQMSECHHESFSAHMEILSIRSDGGTSLRN